MAEKVKLEVEIDSTQAQASADKLGESMENTSEGVQELEGHLDSMTGGAVSGFRGFIQSIGKTVKSFGVLKTAIAATGIGALLIAFKSLQMFFTKTERGAQALRVEMKVLELATDQISDRFVKLGESIFNAFDSGANQGEKQLTFMQKLTGFLAANLESSPIISKYFKGLTVDVITATVKGADLQKQLNEIIVQERELAVERSRRRADLKEYNKIAEDTTKSIAKRQEAAQKTIEIENDLQNKAVDIAKRRLEIITEFNDLAESSEQDLQAQADAEIALNNIRLESAELLTTQQNKLNIIIADGLRLRREAMMEEDKALAKFAEENLTAEADAEIQLVQQTEERKLAIRKDMGEQYVAFQGKLGKDLTDKEKEQIQQGLMFAATMLNTLQGLNESQEANTVKQQKRQFRTGQLLAIAQTSIDTAQAAQAAYKAVVGLGPAGPALAVGAAAAAVAAGLLRVNQIRKQKFEAPTVPQNVPIKIPDFSAPQQSNAAQGIDLNTENQGAGEARFSKTYVLSKDVTSRQELDEQLKRESVI